MSRCKHLTSTKLRCYLVAQTKLLRTFWSLILMHGLQMDVTSLILCNSQLSALSSGFSQCLRLCIPAIAPQWVSLRILVSTQFKDKSYEVLWAILLTKAPFKAPYKEHPLDVLLLVEILLLVFFISAAHCERPISAQNKIKNDSRSWLGCQTLKELMIIDLTGGPFSHKL